MLLIKRIFLGIAAIVLIFLGGNGAQSTDSLTQGSGLIGIGVGIIALYIFAKLIWKAMGCLPSLILLAGMIFFLLYAMGAFKGGINNVVPNLKDFFGKSSSSVGGTMSESNTAQIEETRPPVIELGINENFGDIKVSDAPNTLNQQNQPTQEEQNETKENPQNKNVIPEPEPIVDSSPKRAPQQQEGGKVMGFINKLIGGNNTVVAPRNFNPKDYPAVYGTVQIVDGDTMIMRNHYIRLYGIDAPDIKQSCANSQGRAYQCGKEAALWLQSWIQDNEIECHVLKQDSKGDVVATCSLGQYDIGAALVTAGWAVTLPENNIYKPYEAQAQKAKRGMWQGQFYKPWDWIKIQSKKPKIKVIKPKKKMLWDYL